MFLKEFGVFTLRVYLPGLLYPEGIYTTILRNVDNYHSTQRNILEDLHFYEHICNIFKSRFVLNSQKVIRCFNNKNGVSLPCEGLR